MNLRPAFLAPLLGLALFVTCGLRGHAQVQGRVERDLSGPDWKLWRDRAATWQDDPLYFPVPAIASLPVNPPTGGWDALASPAAVAVSVPGTVEEYLQTQPGPDGDINGVSWWTRQFTLPASAAPRRVLLRFESMRLRAEIFVNRRLVGYDVVGNSPVEVDITGALGQSTTAELAVRITDPGGNYDWRDSSAMRWGKYSLPMSHAFGGITGRVRLVVCDPVYVSDVAVQNLPAITDANAVITVRNSTAVPVRRSIAVKAFPRNDPAHPVFETTLPEATLPAGDTELTVKISAPRANVWDLDHPNLYACEATLRDRAAATDSTQQAFGFRWFAPENIGTDAIFRLNGKRIVLRSAISWGFWPVNGMYPTDELAEKQIRTARALGLNMLNFHRAIGNPPVFEKADELGLLYFEEPGAYKSADRDPFGHALAREKFLRMVRRDRSHPSLVIYNLINEWDSRNPNPDPVEIARHRDDLAAAHAIDPTRVMLHTSAWARGPDLDDPAKLHFRPFDASPHLSGWYDVHHAGGPAVWNESLYRNPADYYGRTDNRREIVFWGEEGAISTPPRLEKIVAALDRLPHAGWDGPGYREWFELTAEFLNRKNLRPAFPTVDAFTSALGNVSLYHQGRRIENMRLSNVADGYAINGWEAELIENHSGVVDCFRNPKGDVAVLAYYNQPLFVAVKLRNTVVQPGDTVVADFFAINELNLHGPHQLRIALRDSAGHELARAAQSVSLTGGETYGELLAPEIRLAVPRNTAGPCRVEAILVDAGGIERARGRDELWVVDWRGDAVTGAGAIWESGSQLHDFLQREKGRGIPAVAPELEKLDWIVVARAPGEGSPVPVPAEVWRQPDAHPGLRATFFSDQEWQREVHQRTDAIPKLSVDDGASPDAVLPVMTNYGVRWEGTLTPASDGRYVFTARTNGRVRLTVNGTQLMDFGPPRRPPEHRGAIELKAGVPVVVRFEFLAGTGAAQCELDWIPSEAGPPVAAEVLERVRRDGTTLVILDRAADWLALIAQQPDATIKYRGAFAVGKTWLGGDHFVREHPLFLGLPANGAMDWPYQSVVRNGDERLGLQVEGDELAAGCYHSFPFQLGDSVGLFPLGRGHVIFSTLDVTGNLGNPEGAAGVACKLLGNYLAHAVRLAQPAPREHR